HVRLHRHRHHRLPRPDLDELHAEALAGVVFLPHRVRAGAGNVTFIRPGKLGDRLVATAREISRNGRSGIYDVSVTSGDSVI
ncbi:hotdog domain-containing protein, partial [Bradyrhizobium brasilense]|uniref:hotdog domain-containing protein n=1 Tax=Bradyrhizobium brasilense TaxID=1419277 RepID=UPI0024C0068F